MDWKPISRQELEALLHSGLEFADDAVLDAWATMRIEPQKWQCSPWGDRGAGFWAVAIRDGQVVWYNDIEDGFNVSPFERHGVIGEYSCNQHDFSDYLATLPEARTAAHWDTEPHQTAPEGLVGPGRISRRQTSSWTLEPHVGSAWRVCFRGAAEAHWAGAEYARFELTRAHPVLVQYQEPLVELHFSGRVSEPERLEATIASAVTGSTLGWRSLDDYRNRHATIAGGYGLLLRAPVSVAAVVQQHLEGAGIACSAFVGLEPAETKQALVLGRSYIVASDFRFVRVSDGNVCPIG